MDTTSLVKAFGNKHVTSSHNVDNVVASRIPKFEKGAVVRTIDGSMIEILDVTSNYYYVHYRVVSNINRDREKTGKFRLIEFERACIEMPKYNDIWNVLNA